MAIFLSLIVLLLVTGYQNCSDNKVNFSSKQKTITNISTQRGNGDSFDGKPDPGDYIRTFPETACTTAHALTQSILTVDKTEANLTTDNCKSTDFPISFTNPSLSSKKYNLDFLTYHSGIFEKSTLVVPNEFNEAFCRYQKDDLGIDVVIKNNLVTGNRKATIYLGRIIDSSEILVEKATGIEVSISQNKNITSYQGTFETLELSISDTSASEVTFPATLKTNVNSQTYDLGLDCLRMNARPVLSLSSIGLLAYWKLDEPNPVNGSTITAAFGPSGVLNTSDTFQKNATGQFGNALAFDGVNDFVRIATPQDGSFDVQSELTLTGWFYRSSSTDDVIIAKRNNWVGVPGSPGYEIHVNDGDDRLLFTIDDGTNVVYFESATAFTTPGWNHFAVVFSKQSSKECHMYVNGVEDTFGLVGDPAALGNVTNNLDVIIGALSSGIHPYEGRLDELSIWKRKLSTEEIKIIYQGNNPLIP